MDDGTATASFESPIGLVIVSADDQFLRRISIGGAAKANGDSRHPIIADTLTQLSKWFAGDIQDFDLPLTPLASAETMALRAGIASIPFGETRTYGTLATATGSAARAVGQACKTNAYPIIIPCHRVVSAAGPEYYSGGGGARTKSWLIDFEYDHLPPERRTRLI